MGEREGGREGGVEVGHSSTRYFSTGGGLGHDSAGLTRLMQDTRFARRSDEGLRGAFKEKTRRDF